MSKQDSQSEKQSVRLASVTPAGAAAWQLVFARLWSRSEASRRLRKPRNTSRITRLKGFHQPINDPYPPPPPYYDAAPLRVEWNGNRGECWNKLVVHVIFSFITWLLSAQWDRTSRKLKLGYFHLRLNFAFPDWWLKIIHSYFVLLKEIIRVQTNQSVTKETPVLISSYVVVSQTKKRN